MLPHLMLSEVHFDGLFRKSQSKLNANLVEVLQATIRRSSIKKITDKYKITTNAINHL